MEAGRKEKVERAILEDSRVLEGRVRMTERQRGWGPKEWSKLDPGFHAQKYHSLKRKSLKTLHTWHQKK